MDQPYRKSGAPEIDRAALEKLSKLAEQVGVSLEDLIFLLEKKPELVRNQVGRIREETQSATELLKIIL